MGLKDEQIARMIGLTVSGLHTIKQRPEYKTLIRDLMAGAQVQYDAALALDADKMREEFAVGVPTAMRTLVEACTQRKDLKTALEASKELLDRDPKRTFVKPGLKTGTGAEAPQLSEGILNQFSKGADSIAATLATPREKVN